MSKKMTRSLTRILAGALLAGSATVMPVGTPSSAQAAGTPDIEVTKSMPAETLYGATTPVSISVANPGGPDGFNMMIRDVLPPGTSLSNPSVPPTAEIGQLDGSTVVIWRNVADSLTGTTVTVSYDLVHDPADVIVGDSLVNEASAFVNDNARLLPNFDGEGDPIASTYTGDDAAPAAETLLIPFELTKIEPSVEDELLRGVQDHQTVFTLQIDNNHVGPTNNFQVVDYLPAELEFLGCGNVDNSTGGEEYTGSDGIDDHTSPTFPAARTCVPASTVETVEEDPDGAGPMAYGVYTKITWDSATIASERGTANLLAGEQLFIDYVVGAPLFANTYPGPANPTANLDNNDGDLTTESETTAQNFAFASGQYVADSQVYVDDDIEQVLLEDIHIVKTTATENFVQGDIVNYTLDIFTSEYATETGPITVTDTLPAALDFVSANPAPDAGPSYDSDGRATYTWVLDPAVGPNHVDQITLSTEVREWYRDSSGNDSSNPVASNDSFRNVTDLSADVTVITDAAVNTETLPMVDDSSAGSSALGIAVSKDVSEPIASGTLTCGNGSAANITWNEEFASSYRPGDVVCFRITVDFRDGLDTLAVRLTDFLPDGFVLDPALAPADAWAYGDDSTVLTVQDFDYDHPSLDWDLGDVDDNRDGTNEVFQVVLQTVVNDPAAAAPADILDNLAKLRHANTAGEIFQHRDQALAEWSEPILDLSKGVITLNGAAVPGAPADGVIVQEGDTVRYQIIVSNVGDEPASNTEIRDVLPGEIECGNVTNISDGGECTVVGGISRIDWDKLDTLDIDAGANITLTYDVLVPDGISAGATLTNHAGVRTYEGDTNSGSPFEYVPSDNIDTSLTPNTSPADDPSNIVTDDPTLTKTASTSITEDGNRAVEDATIGETINYTVSTTLAPGLTYHDGAVSDTVPAGFDLDETTVAVTLDGGLAPGAWTLTTDDTTNSWNLDLGDTYVVPGGAPHQVEVTFSVLVLDAATNLRGVDVENTATFSWESADGRTDSVEGSTTVTIVEPNITIEKTDTDDNGSVVGGDDVAFELTVTNDSSVNDVSVAHDTVVVDTVPEQLIVLDGVGGNPVGDGDTVGPNGGTWSDASRTITWTIDEINPGDSTVLTYYTTVVDPIVAGGAIVNEAEVTTTSIDGSDPDERDDESPDNAGYSDDDNNSLDIPEYALVKGVSGTDFTVGESVEYTLALTVPSGVIAYDATIIDEIPDGVTFESLDSVACTAGGGACADDINTATVLPASGYTTGSDVAFQLDLAAASTEERVVTFTYTAVIADAAAADSGASLTNTATLYWNNTDQPDLPDFPDPDDFDRSTDPDEQTVGTVEPTLVIDKDVNGQIDDDDWRRAKPGDVLTYTVAVTNTGTSAAFDGVISDTPSDPAWAFADTTDPGQVTDFGIANTDDDATDGDGFEWSFDGPLDANETLTITYTLTVPASYNSDQENTGGPEQSNTADVDSYYGVPVDVQDPNREYREYDDVVADTVEIELDLASIGDYVWFDVNNDGVQDPGEPVLAGVAVTVTYSGADGIFGNGDDESYPTVTGPDGKYLVEHLPGGTFRVDVDETTLPIDGLTPSYDLDGTALTPNGVWEGGLDEDEDKADVDFGYTGTGSIGELIWLDQDLSGDQNGGESGLPNVDLTVTWYGPDGQPNTGDEIEYPATTGPLGQYLVENLPAGEYSVEVDTNDPDLPASYVNVADPDAPTSADNDSKSELTLGSGEDNRDQNFGYAGNGSIGDTIWLDRDGDGEQDVAGEPGLAGIPVTVVHYGPDGVLGTADDSTFVTTTNSDGHYLVDNLPVGTYDVTVSGAITNLENSGDPDTAGLGDNMSTVDLTDAAPDNVEQDFGYFADTVLGDTVWIDLNQDDVFDPANEFGIADVRVVATGPHGLQFETVTADDGSYMFSNLAPGDWTITIDGTTLPSGVTPTYDFDGVGSPNESQTTLDVADLDQDFAYLGDGSIGDTVWLDLDADGTLNGQEVGLGNVTVTLEWSGAPGQSISTTTAPDGTYLFDHLPDGDYTITVDTSTLPDGLDPTFDHDGGLDSTSVTTLEDGARTDLDQDFGYRGSGVIGDTIWFDRNSDGRLDGNETGLPGIDVTLTWAGPNGPVTFTTVSNGEGQYLFEHLPAGDFEVAVDTANLPAGMTATFDADGGDDSVSALTLEPGAENLDQDFGYAGAGSIGDTIWLDLDGNGVHDAGEPGVPNQTVELTWNSPTGPVAYTTTTDDSGEYRFEHLPPANYTITVVGGIVDDATNTGDPDGVTDSTSTITLADGEENLDQDFGYQGNNSIGDTVWHDVNADGNDDGAAYEARLENIEVTVTWHGPDGEPGTDDDIALPTYTTDAAGLYLSTGLPDGNYTVAITNGLPAGLDTNTYDDDGDLNATSVVTGLGVGTDDPVDNLDQDFGFAGAGVIGDTVWLDLDGDGSQGTKEPGIPEAEVTLTWYGPDGEPGTPDDVVYPTVITGDTGNYQFTDLPAGGFDIAVVQPLTGVEPTADPDGGADSMSSVVLAPGEENLDQDFGYRGDVSVGDTIFIDVGGNGSQEANEPGVPGVTVIVTVAGGDGELGTDDDIVTVTETDENGQYLADGLPAGPIQVSYDADDLPDGYSPNSDLDGGDATNTVITTEPGDAPRDVDFGIVGGAKISGVVCVDPNTADFSGIDVTITWQGPNGPVTVVVQTDENCEYELDDLPPGDYTVVVDADDFPPGYVPLDDDTTTVSLAPGDDAAANVPFVPESSIGDRVWNDRDGDGIQDPGEPGISGVRITLVAPDGTLTTTTTDANGNYLFDGLAPGNYVVRIDLTTINGDQIVFELDGTRDGNVAVELGAGVDRTDVDFGIAEVSLPSAGSPIVRTTMLASFLLAIGIFLIATRRRKDAAIRA